MGSSSSQDRTASASVPAEPSFLSHKPSSFHFLLLLLISTHLHRHVLTSLCSMHLLTSIFERSSTAAQTALWFFFFFFLMTPSECILDFHPMEEWECLSCMSMNCQHLKVWGVRWGQCDSEAMGSVDWVSMRMFAHTVNTPAVVFVLHHVLSCLDETVGWKWGWWCSRFKCSRQLSLNWHPIKHISTPGDISWRSETISGILGLVLVTESYFQVPI